MARQLTIGLFLVQFALCAAGNPSTPGECALDAARFRDLGPAFLDQQTQLAWRYCATPQSIDVKTKQCSGAIFATENLGRDDLLDHSRRVKRA